MFNQLSRIGISLKSTNFRKVFVNTVWLFGEKIFQMCLGLLVGAWVARYLGPDRYGMLNYAVTFVGMFTAISNLGLDSIVVRELVSKPEQENQILGTAFGLKIFSGLLTILLTFGIIIRLRPSDQIIHYLVIATAAGSIFQCFDVIDFWFRSKIQSKYTVLGKNTSYLISTFIRLIAIQKNASVVFFALARSLEIALGGLSLALIYNIRGHTFRLWQFSLPVAKKFLSDSWPLILAGISTYIYATIDQLMLGQMASTKSLGIYASAVKISEIFNFVPVVIAQSVLPSLVNKYKEGEEELLSVMQNLYDIMSIVWFFTAVFISLFAGPIIHLMYGNSYKGASIVLSIYIWSQFGSNFGVARSLYVNVKNLFKYSLIISICGAVCNIGLNYWLIPSYKEIGATISTLVTYFLVTVVMNLFFPELRKLFPLIIKSLMIHQAIMRTLQFFKSQSNYFDKTGG